MAKDASVSASAAQPASVSTHLFSVLAVAADTGRATPWSPRWSPERKRRDPCRLLLVAARFNPAHGRFRASEALAWRRELAHECREIAEQSLRLANEKYAGVTSSAGWIADEADRACRGPRCMSEECLGRALYELELAEEHADGCREVFSRLQHGDIDGAASVAGGLPYDHGEISRCISVAKAAQLEIQEAEEEMAATPQPSPPSRIARVPASPRPRSSMRPCRSSRTSRATSATTPSGSGPPAPECSSSPRRSAATRAAGGFVLIPCDLFLVLDAKAEAHAGALS